MEIVFKKYYLLLGIVTLSNISLSQERFEIKIKVYTDGLPVVRKDYDALNLNLISQLPVKNGHNSIRAGKNDTILITYTPLNYRRFVVVSEEIIRNKYMNVYFNSYPIVLNNVFVTENSNHNKFHEMEEGKKLSPGERKLMTAGKENLKLSNILHNLFTKGIIATDPFINVINGRMKRLEKEVVIESKKRVFTFLKKNYSDFMINEMLLPKDKIGLFFYYVSDRMEAVGIDYQKNHEHDLQNFYLDFIENYY